MQRRVVLTGRSRPHELLLLALSVVTGLAYLLGSPPPGSVTALMPAWQIDAWAGGLLFSGLLGLFGCLWRRDVERALIAEGAAMLIGAGATVLYAWAAFEVGGPRALLPAGTVLAWCAANLWRAAQIRRDLGALLP